MFYAARGTGCGILSVMAASPQRPDPLKPAGFFLLIMGWILILAAIALLKQDTARGGFVLAGFAVEAVGLVLVARSHIPAHIAPQPGRN